MSKHGYENTSVEEIRQILQNDYGVTDVDVLKQSKKPLVELLLNLQNSKESPEISVDEESGFFGGIEELDDDEKDAIPEEVDKTPSFGSDEWTDYVLGQLRPSELYEGRPLCIGLRNLVEKFIGPIVSKTIFHVGGPDGPNGVATVGVRITCAVTNDKHPAYYGSKDQMITEDSIADCGIYNTQGEYAKHQSAMAETRAESRAFRKMLRLSNTVAAEEIDDNPISFKPNDKVDEKNIQMIDIVAKRYDVNVGDLIALSPNNYKNVFDMTKEHSAILIGYITDIGNNRIKKPSSIGSYDSSWKNKE